jgi:hypothetical protein
VAQHEQNTGYPEIRISLPVVGWNGKDYLRTLTEIKRDIKLFNVIKLWEYYVAEEPREKELKTRLTGLASIDKVMIVDDYEIKLKED